MTSLALNTPAAKLAAHEGQVLLSAPEALLKGVLEAEVEVALLTGPRAGDFAAVFDVGMEAPVEALLKQHGTRLNAAPDAGRAITLARFAARSGRGSIALVPNDQLDHSIHAINQAMAEPLDSGSAMCVILEDAPAVAPVSEPRNAVARLHLPCLEPANLEQLLNGIESALRISRAGRCVIGLVVHTSIWRTADTLDVRPNRTGGSVEAMLARRKRRASRGSEAGGWLRMARRLELNRFRAMPSPGERVNVGFITVGPADGAMLHLTSALGLMTRVPVLQLGLIQPVDESAVGRLLTRCQQVIVLEPRPGTMEASVLAVAEAMRLQGEQPASVWGARIPPDGDSAAFQLESDEDLHPSVLVRKIAHLLHEIRPTVQVASQLLADPPQLAVEVAPRGEQIGTSAAVAAVRSIVTDVDQWLREQAVVAESEIPPTVLAIDGAEAKGASGRIVNVEMWDHRRFQHDGIIAIIQAAREDQPWIIIACEEAAEEIRDLERLARGAVPADRADRVVLETGNLADLVALRETIRQAALVDRLTVLIVRDGPPATFDVAAIDQTLAEIDQLGFEPRQRIIRSIEELCAFHVSPDEVEEETNVERDTRSARNEFSVERLTASDTQFQFRVRPSIEEVEVIRTKPPMRNWRASAADRVPSPQAVHGKHPLWRAHLAGFRSHAPGVAAVALSEAGRLMGYHVRMIHSPTPIGSGLRAWTQVLFTRRRESEASITISAEIPYGEADLVLGLEPQETLRAIGPDASLRVAFADRTYVVANVGPLGPDVEQTPVALEVFAAALSQVSRSEPRLINNFASACRTWFHTDRVTDMALLGAAFQLGLIPVSPESIEAGVNLAESRGFGRARETFEFGRRLAVDVRLFKRLHDAREEEIRRVVRRTSLSMSRGWRLRRAPSRDMGRLVHESLLLMPGLAETEAGRIARRDFVNASHRCMAWGGLSYAQQYTDLITRLYKVDRGDTGRVLTRDAVLPLAEAMLIRDPLYVASMAMSAEQRRRMNSRLNVKHARGDRVVRRYVTRLELIALKRRFRAVVRSSDWPARVTALAGRLTPIRWRGSKRERELREYVVDVMKRAIEEASADYERWAESMRRLNLQAAENRLRGMALAEIRMLVEGASFSPINPTV